MATTVATKPMATHQQKMKRPPLPAVQTNGAPSSQSSPSPSMSSKRPPSGFKAPPPAPTVNGVGGVLNGPGPRLSQRRRDSQKPGDNTVRNRGKDGERKVVKRAPEPYVKTQGYILKKYRKAQPSLIIHLHPTNFRFDQQDGSFSYNSPMKVVLEHLKSQTVPHDMLEELINAGVKFYESCLIVQVKDHRSIAGDKSSKANPTVQDSYMPFSIHNYNSFLTPSPYAPYPEQKNVEAINARRPSDPQANNAVKEANKSQEPKTFTVVLFPTPLSIAEEVFIQANTPDSRPGNRKSQSVNMPRTPASATMPHPPTPLSAVPPTPSTIGPPMKRQKMSISGPEIQGFESKIIAATAPPLCLDLVDDLEDATKLLEMLSDPLHSEKLPAPKTRKRTVAELAADERIAAQEQAFMLIMDERIGNSTATSKTASGEEAGIAPFEPRFEKFNAIQQIKAQHEENARQKERFDAEAKRQQMQKAKHDQEEREKQKMIALQRQQHEQAQNELRQRAATAGQNHMALSHPNGMMQNGISQPQHSSPIVRNATPHRHSSPLAGNMVTSASQSIPMKVTSSNQGHQTSSPQRPPSAAQHRHPATGGIAMVHKRSQQQMPSRTGTPQMGGTPNMNGTPILAHSTPVMNHAMPTPQMSHGSPQNGMLAPVMNTNNNMMANGNAQAIQTMHKQQQQQQLQQQQRAYAHQQQHLQQQQQQQQMQHSPNHQMSPDRAQMQHLQQVSNQHQLQREAYRQGLANHHAPGASMNGAYGNPNISMAMSPHGPQHPQHPQQQQQQQPQTQPAQHPGQTPTQLNPATQAQNHMMAVQTHRFRKNMEQLMAKYNGNQTLIPQNEIVEARRDAQMAVQAYMKKSTQDEYQKKVQEARQKQQMRQHMLQMQQMQQQGARVVGGGGGGGGGILGGMQGQMGMPGGQQQAFTQQQMMAQMAQMSHMGGAGGMGGMGGMGGGMQ